MACFTTETQWGLNEYRGYLLRKTQTSKSDNRKSLACARQPLAMSKGIKVNPLWPQYGAALVLALAFIGGFLRYTLFGWFIEPAEPHPLLTVLIIDR